MRSDPAGITGGPDGCPRRRLRAPPSGKFLLQATFHLWTSEFRKFVARRGTTRRGQREYVDRVASRNAAGKNGLGSKIPTVPGAPAGGLIEGYGFTAVGIAALVLLATVEDSVTGAKHCLVHQRVGEADAGTEILSCPTGSVYLSTSPRDTFTFGKCGGEVRRQRRI